jgi:hypothetical protein
MNNYYLSTFRKTKLLVITITTAAIIAAVTTTVSAATPAFAKVNCNEDNSVCTGGQSLKKCDGCIDAPGGAGGRNVQEESGAGTNSGGFGGQIPQPGGDTLVGGGGGHVICDAVSCSDPVGGSGFHEKGPGGNSDNALPP